MIWVEVEVLSGKKGWKVGLLRKGKVKVMRYCFFFMSFTWWCQKHIWLYSWTLLCEVYITFWCTKCADSCCQLSRWQATSNHGTTCILIFSKAMLHPHHPKSTITQTPLVHTKSSFLFLIHSNYYIKN